MAQPPLSSVFKLSIPAPETLDQQAAPELELMLRAVENDEEYSNSVVTFSDSVWDLRQRAKTAVPKSSLWFHGTSTDKEPKGSLISSQELYVSQDPQVSEWFARYQEHSGKPVLLTVRLYNSPPDPDIWWELLLSTLEIDPTNTESLKYFTEAYLKHFMGKCWVYKGTFSVISRREL